MAAVAVLEAVASWTAGQRRPEVAGGGSCRSSHNCCKGTSRRWVTAVAGNGEGRQRPADCTGKVAGTVGGGAGRVDNPGGDRDGGRSTDNHAGGYRWGSG